MKKLIATLFAVVFLVGFTFAQNTDSTAQTGNSNLSKTIQSGNNDAYSVQVGTSQNATLTQDGANTGGIYQLDNGNNNQGTLSQSGSGNEGYIIQGMTQVPNLTPQRTGQLGSKYSTLSAQWNTASVTQLGTSNKGYAEQYGGSYANGNQATIYQKGTGNTAEGYNGWAYPDMGGYTLNHLQSYNSTVNISQVGNNNYTGAWQYGGNNDNASITENGNHNFAEIAQGYVYNVPGLAFNEPVYNTQNNNASVTQSGNYNHEKLFQLGDNNSFKLSQANGSSVGYNGVGYVSPVYNAYFRQEGNNNQFAGVNKSGNNISFNGSAAAQQMDGATLDAVSEGINGYTGSFQKGDYNTIGLSQYNDNALMQQIGNSNTEVLWQGGTAVNSATMLQNGNSNTASLVQQ